MTTRRGFFALVVASSLATGVASAQPRDKVWRLGYLTLAPLADPPSPERAAFIAALRDLGYVSGRNLAIVYRSADADRERLAFLAEELVAEKVDAIAVGSSDPARAALDATKTVPIVMLGVGDPIAFGLVTNLARPGANITGMSWQSVDLVGKRFGLLKEVMPRCTRVAFLANPDTVASGVFTPAQAAAQKNGMTLDELRIAGANDLKEAIQALEKRRPDAMYVNIDTRLAAYRQLIADAAIRLGLPSIAGYRPYAEAGGLLSYGADLVELYRRGARYVDRIFRGAKAGDLPIEQPTKFELAVNLRTAKAIGLAIPRSVLLRADQVIQ